MINHLKSPSQAISHPTEHLVDLRNHKWSSHTPIFHFQVVFFGIPESWTVLDSDIVTCLQPRQNSCERHLFQKKINSFYSSKCSIWSLSPTSYICFIEAYFTTEMLPSVYSTSRKRIEKERMGWSVEDKGVGTDKIVLLHDRSEGHGLTTHSYPIEANQLANPSAPILESHSPRQPSQINPPVHTFLTNHFPQLFVSSMFTSYNIHAWIPPAANTPV